MLKRFAIFDLDRTITTFGTFTPFLLSTRKSPLTRAALLSAFLPNMIAYKSGLIDRRILKDKMLSAALNRFSRRDIEDLSQSFVTRTLTAQHRPAALEAIARHKANGDRLVLATASVDFYASIFASQLGFDLCVATRTNFSDRSGAPLKITGPNCYGADKINMVTAALGNESGAPRDQQHWTFYSDHHSDFALCALADECFVVSPDSKTSREAAKRNFPILDW